MSSALRPWRPEVVDLASDSCLIVRGERHTGVRLSERERSGRTSEGTPRRLARADAFSRVAGRSRCRRTARTSRPRAVAAAPPIWRAASSGPLLLWSSAELPLLVPRLLWSLLLWSSASSGPLLLWSSAELPPLVHRAAS